MKHAPLHLHGRPRRLSGAPLPAVQMSLTRVARLWLLGLSLAGCGDREGSPLGPPARTAPAPAERTGDAIARAEKERNAVDLGARSTSSAAPAAMSVTVESATSNSIPFAPKPGP